MPTIALWDMNVMKEQTVRTQIPSMHATVTTASKAMVSTVLVMLIMSNKSPLNVLTRAMCFHFQI